MKKQGDSRQEQAKAKSLEKQGSPQKSFSEDWISDGTIMAVRVKAEHTERREAQLRQQNYIQDV